MVQVNMPQHSHGSAPAVGDDCYDSADSDSSSGSSIPPFAPPANFASYHGLSFDRRRSPFRVSSAQSAPPRSHEPKSALEPPMVSNGVAESSGRGMIETRDISQSNTFPSSRPMSPSSRKHSSDVMEGEEIACLTCLSTSGTYLLWLHVTKPNRDTCPSEDQ